MPLPVEAAAAAEDAHWRSRRSPNRHRPRPRCASTGTQPRHVRSQRVVYAPGRLVSLEVAHLDLAFQMLNPQPSLFQLCANHIRLWAGDLNQGILSPAQQYQQSRLFWPDLLEGDSNSDI